MVKNELFGWLIIPSWCYLRVLKMHLTCHANYYIVPKNIKGQKEEKWNKKYFESRFYLCHLLVTFRRGRLQSFLTSTPTLPPLWSSRTPRTDMASEPKRECHLVRSSHKKLKDLHLVWQEMLLDHRPPVPLLKQNVQEVYLKSRGHMLQRRKTMLQPAYLYFKKGLSEDRQPEGLTRISEPGPLAHFGEWWHKIIGCNLKSKVVEYIKWLPSACLQKHR